MIMIKVIFYEQEINFHVQNLGNNRQILKARIAGKKKGDFKSKIGSSLCIA